MCLREVKEFKPCTTGYKVVCKPHNSYHPQFQNRWRILYRNKWLSEESYRLSSNTGIISVTGNNYPFGFHVWHTKVSARRWMKRCDGSSTDPVILKVKVKNPRCTGLQGVGIVKNAIIYARVTVAKQIKILEEVK